jgi:hypothetical protein
MNCAEKPALPLPRQEQRRDVSYPLQASQKQHITGLMSTAQCLQLAHLYQVNGRLNGEILGFTTDNDFICSVRGRVQAKGDDKQQR